jgi:branched-chain amino acid transport system permease protein
MKAKKWVWLFLAVGLIAPFVFGAFINQLSFLAIFIILALTWDIQGGQMGYNSFGNIAFFGIGMYVSVAVHVSLFFDLASWTASGGVETFVHSPKQYFIGLISGLIAAGIIPAIIAALFGSLILAMRGQYFAICTLGLGIALGEIAGSIEIIGAGSGISVPVWPEITSNLKLRDYTFYYLSFALAFLCLVTLRYLYKNTKFGLLLNAIRDDEDKAQAMGIYTTSIKAISWVISAFFLGIAGAIMGNVIGFIEATDVAFAGATFGVWMVLMAILGGKGSLWGPVIGAIIFHFFQEFFWIYFLGWQRVALGLLIIIIVVFFPQGIAGWMQERYPHLFGRQIESQEHK